MHYCPDLFASISINPGDAHNFSGLSSILLMAQTEFGGSSATIRTNHATKLTSLNNWTSKRESAICRLDRERANPLLPTTDLKWPWRWTVTKEPMLLQRVHFTAGNE
jgi:hypothetical protein